MSITVSFIYSNFTLYSFPGSVSKCSRFRKSNSFIRRIFESWLYRAESSFRT